MRLGLDNTYVGRDENGESISFSYDRDAVVWIARPIESKKVLAKHGKLSVLSAFLNVNKLERSEKSELISA